MRQAFTRQVFTTGLYIFNDRNMVGVGVADVDDCALTVITTVVSTSVLGRAIIDADQRHFHLIVICRGMDEALVWSSQIPRQN